MGNYGKGFLAVICGLILTLVLVPAVWGQDAQLQLFKALSGKIDIAGGTAHIPVMKEAAEQIMKANPQIRITVAGGGSGVGVQKVGAGLVDIGNTGRALKPGEVSKYGLKTFPFAIDGVAVAVNPKNPVGALTAQQVRDIFAGKIKNWQQVGGKNAPIHLFTRDEASGTRETFWKKLLKKGPIDAKANVVASNGAMKLALAQDPQGIGYLGIGFVDQKVTGIKLDGVEPTQKNAQSGAYPVTRKLYMNTKGEPNPLVKAFIIYIQGPAGAKSIQKHGFIPLSK
ncbi:MAG: phosphate ABC transporter substrate-binding protein [Syntrophales bacterium]|nr:phosphate ABC transporter substrate-binding protein [Syntrophales bacterium]